MFAALQSAWERWATYASDARLALAAAAMTVVMALPGFVTLPPVDRDEARFAQASKQMMETNDFVDIRLQDEARHKKPVGIHWLQVAAAEASGWGEAAPIWVYRIPSLIGIALAAALTVRIAALFTGGAAALTAGLLVGAAILPGVEARLAKTDAMLLAAIVALHWPIAIAWTERGRDARIKIPAAILTGVALAAGLLIKGPIAPMVAGLTIAALCLSARSVRWTGAMRPAIVLVVGLALAAPWYVAIGLETDWAFYRASAGDDLLAKAARGRESHGAPPGVHLAAMIGTFWPISALLLAAWPGWAFVRRSDAARFALCWAAPTWLLFELVPTKLPHYVLPILPAIALSTVVALGERSAGARWLRRIGRGLVVFVPLVFACVLAAASVHLQSPRPAVGAAVLAVAAVIAWRWARGGSTSVPPLRVLAVAFLTSLGVYPFGLAGFSPVWIGPKLQRAVETQTVCPAPRLAIAGFREPSAVFLLGTDLLQTDGPGAAAFLDAEGCRLAFVESRREADFLRASPGAVALETVDGLNLNGGDDLRITLYRAAP